MSDPPMKSQEQWESDVAPGRTAPQRRKPHSLSVAVFLRARVETGISTSTADNQGQDSTLMRLWQQCDYAIYIRMPDIG